MDSMSYFYKVDSLED